MALILSTEISQIGILLYTVNILDWALCSPIDVTTVGNKVFNPNFSIVWVCQLAWLVGFYLLESSPFLMFLIVPEVFHDQGLSIKSNV
jgi:hypothetical protein